MGNLILNFLQEQGTLIILGLMVIGGSINQILNTRRYRKLRNGIRSFAALQSPTVHNTEADVESQDSIPAKRTSRRFRRGRRRAESVQALDVGPEMSGENTYRQASVTSMRNQTTYNQPIPDPQPHNPQSEGSRELDAQLLYLKQSLDRIAAGRDQTLEEEVRERRKLTPEQEEIIADILKEYLS